MRNHEERRMEIPVSPISSQILSLKHFMSSQRHEQTGLSSFLLPLPLTISFLNFLSFSDLVAFIICTNTSQLTVPMTSEHLFHELCINICTWNSFDWQRAKTWVIRSKMWNACCQSRKTVTIAIQFEHKCILLKNKTTIFVSHILSGGETCF